MNASLRKAIMHEMQCRARRNRNLPPELLGEPAWDILLDLALSYLDGRRIQTTAVGLNVGLPTTTTLRWVGHLVAHGLVNRIPDADDGRRTWLELCPETMSKIATCFGYEWPEPQPETPDQDPTSPSVFLFGENEANDDVNEKPTLTRQ